MLKENGVLRCVKDVFIDGNKAFTEGKEYRYWKGTYYHSAYNDMKQPHIIYSERNGDVENFISEHFKIVS